MCLSGASRVVAKEFYVAPVAMEYFGNSSRVPRAVRRQVCSGCCDNSRPGDTVIKVFTVFRPVLDGHEMFQISRSIFLNTLHVEYILRGYTFWSVPRVLNPLQYCC